MMKKMGGLLAAAMVLLAFTVVPVIAQEISTSVEIEAVNNNGDSPLVKCKWECETPAPITESGDPDHLTPGAQFSSPGAANEAKEIYYYAVVTDPQGLSTIQDVKADVYHPDGTFKYKARLTNVVEKPTAIEYVEDAYEAGLLTIADGIALEDIIYELSQDEAWLFWGMAELSYCQAAGDYLVEVSAKDVPGASSEILSNTFTYEELCMLEYDFEALNYGKVALKSHVWKGGDTDFGTADSPTVRNVGNVPAQVTIKEDDMGFGYAYVDGIKNWNVEYDARIGAYGPISIYYPDTWENDEPVTLETVMDICHTDKLDFSITVIEDDRNDGSYSGNMVLGCVKAPVE